MKHIRKIELDIDREYFEKIPSVQYDNNSRYLHITLMSGVGPIDVTGHRVIVSAKKPDKTEIFNDCKIIDAKQGLIEMHLSEQIGAVDGVVDCNMKIFGEDNSLLSSRQFHIYVSPSADANGVASSNEFKALVDAISVVQSIDNKMNKYTPIPVQQIDKNSGKFDQTYMSEELLKQMAGNTPINAIPADGSLTQDKYAFDSIGADHINFVKTGINLFDATTISQKGWWCSTADGLPAQNQYVTDKHYSALMTVLPNEQYVTSLGVHSYCIYDVNRKFVKGETATRVPFTIPENGAFMRVTVYSEYIDSIQVQKGSAIQYDYEYEISMPKLDVTRKFNSAEKDIYSIPQIRNNINSLKHSLNESFTPIDKVIDAEFKPFSTWGYTSSTFSGWASYIGKVDKLNKLQFKVRCRKGESKPITRIRCTLLKGSSEGEILQETDITVNIAPNVEKIVDWNLLETIVGPSEGLYFSFQCDSLCDLASAGSLTNTDPATRYSVSGNITAVSKMTPVGNSGGACIWTKCFFLTKEYGIPESALSSLLDKPAFNKSFTVDSQFIKLEQSGPYVSDSYASSTFSGWGTHIGEFKQIECLAFIVNNRDTKPVTQVRCYITDFNKDGTILAEGSINVNVLPNQKTIVKWILDTPLNNSAGKKLYFTYQCNAHITLATTNLPGPSNNKEYGWNSYCVDGSFVQPSNMTQVYGDTSGGSFGIWCEIGQVERVYKPTESFLAYLQGDEKPSDYCRVILPDKITAVVGDNLQIFNRGILDAVNPYNYDVRIKCAKGKQFPRYFEFNPTAQDVGTYTFEVSVYNNQTMLLDKGTCNLEVVNPGNSPSQPKNVLCVGDSLTAGGVWPTEARRRLTQSGGQPSGLNKQNINFIGTVTNSSGANWEGYGGWTWGSYLQAPNVTTSDIWLTCTHDKTAQDQHSIWQDSNGSKWKMETIQTGKIKFTRYENHRNQPPSAPGQLTHVSNATHTGNISFTHCKVADGNPFWDMETNKVNFKKYCENHNFTGIDYVYTLLTWNGGVCDKWNEDKNESVVQQAREFLDILHQDYPNAKVKILGIQMPSLNGGTGSSYGAKGEYSFTHGLVRGVCGLNLAYKKLANDPKYSTFVEFIQTSAEFDSEYLMAYAMTPVNNRSTVTEMRGTNGVHPSTEGYLAIGDVAYRSMVKTLLE